jgi:hypothetical protein
MATIDMDQVAFNVAKANSVLTFEIKQKTGFVATAKLDLDIENVAKWKSEEIVGKVVEETLVPVGLYTLEIKVVATSKTPIDIEVEVTVAPPKKGASEVHTLNFRNKKGGDICQAIAFVLIA